MIDIDIDTDFYKFDIHGSVHRRLLSRNTNKNYTLDLIDQ